MTSLSDFADELQRLATRQGLAEAKCRDAAPRVFAAVDELKEGSEDPAATFKRLIKNSQTLSPHNRTIFSAAINCDLQPMPRHERVPEASQKAGFGTVGLRDNSAIYNRVKGCCAKFASEYLSPFVVDEYMAAALSLPAQTKTLRVHARVDAPHRPPTSILEERHVEGVHNQKMLSWKRAPMDVGVPQVETRHYGDGKLVAPTGLSSGRSVEVSFVAPRESADFTLIKDFPDDGTQACHSSLQYRFLGKLDQIKLTAQFRVSPQRAFYIECNLATDWPWDPVVLEELQVRGAADDHIVSVTKIPTVSREVGLVWFWHNVAIDNGRLRLLL